MQKKLTNKSLSLFIANDNGMINTKENKMFIEKFISEVIPKNEQNKYITDKGGLSQEGLTRVKNAIFYKAYNDVSLMNQLSESLDNNIKNITNTLLSIAPKISNLKIDIENGTAYNIDYSKDIAEAVNIYSNLKETNQNIEMYLSQKSLFDDENTALIKDLVAILSSNNRSSKKLTSFFNSLLDDIKSLGNPNQISLFEEKETFNKVDMLEAALRRFDDANKDNQINIFDTEPKTSTENIKHIKTKEKEVKTQNYTGTQSFKGGKIVTNSDVVDMSRKLKSVTEIKRGISKTFKVSVSEKTNKFTKRSSLGIYKVVPEVIMTKYNNELGTIVHELGHHLDKKYSFNNINPKLIKDMIDKMENDFKKHYKPNELKGEAVAEFFKILHDRYSNSTRI